jgi:hypothetical protein
MATLKKEKVSLSNYQTFEEAQTRLPHFIEEAQNLKKANLALGYLSPMSRTQINSITFMMCLYLKTSIGISENKSMVMNLDERFPIQRVLVVSTTWNQSNPIQLQV